MSIVWFHSLAVVGISKSISLVKFIVQVSVAFKNRRKLTFSVVRRMCRSSMTRPANEKTRSHGLLVAGIDNTMNAS